MSLKKTMLSTAVGLTLGVLGVSNAHAAAITQILITDVGSTSNCPTDDVEATCISPVYSPVLDGESGLFDFFPINPGTATSPEYASFFSDVGPMLWGGVDNALGSFSTGFLFGSGPFVPYVLDSPNDPTPNGGGAVGDITGGVLTVSSLAFGGNFNGTSDFDLQPGPRTPVVVNWVVPTANPNEFLVNFQWSHVISNGTVFDGFHARWLIEGIATTAPVPVPAAVWLFGSGLAGIAALARRRKKI